MGCGGNADRIFRHNSLRDAVFSAAQSAALAPRKEVPSLAPRIVPLMFTYPAGKEATQPPLSPSHPHPVPSLPLTPSPCPPLPPPSHPHPVPLSPLTPSPCPPLARCARILSKVEVSLPSWVDHSARTVSRDKLMNVHNDLT